MTLIRSLVLPTAIATPLWLWISPILIRGLGALRDFYLTAADLVFGFVITVIGLLLIGLPTASFVMRRKWVPAVRVASLLFAGAAGGGLFAMLYVLLIVVLADGLNSDSLAGIPPLAVLGFIPGMVVAAVWIATNFNELTARTKENRDA